MTLPAKKSSAPKSEPEGFQFEILTAHDFNPRDCALVCVAGPPGDGKSSLLGQMCAEGPTLLLSTLAREASSMFYQQFNPDVILLEDTSWKPMPPDKNDRPRGQYIATAYNQFMEIMELLAQDEILNADGKPYKVVLIDSWTELAEAAWHEALAPFGVMDPAYMTDSNNRFGPYTALGGLMDRAIKATQSLKTAPLPKIVGISMHIQPTKDDTTERIGDKVSGYTVKKQSADRKSEGAEYEGSYLPQIRGGFRRKLFGLVDAVVWVHVEHEPVPSKPGGKKTTRPRYLLQVQTDEDRHCKIPGPVPPTKYIDNSWKHLKALLAPVGDGKVSKK